jgi:hypothetical protein
MVPHPRLLVRDDQFRWARIRPPGKKGDEHESSSDRLMHSLNHTNMTDIALREVGWKYRTPSKAVPKKMLVPASGFK